MKFKAAVATALAACVLAGCGRPSDESFVPTRENMLPAATNIWSGVRVFDVKNFGTSGPGNMVHVLDVLGGNDNYMRDGVLIRGVKVRLSSGGEEWWKRDTWASQGGFDYFVRADDPALAKKEWKTYTE